LGQLSVRTNNLGQLLVRALVSMRSMGRTWRKLKHTKKYQKRRILTQLTQLTQLKRTKKNSSGKSGGGCQALGCTASRSGKSSVLWTQGQVDRPLDLRVSRSRATIF
jgi:hypothetical protein